ncbi:MAG: amidohydrolase family protein, partial [bacterium]
ALDQASQFVEKYLGAANGRINGRLGPHAPYTCPEPFLVEVLNRAQSLKCGIHIHLAETKSEVQGLMKETGQTPVEFYCKALRDVGSVSSLAAHCVYISDRDIDLLAENNIGVAHNPGSNLKLASGVAPLPALLQQGINVGLGTDGAASNNNLDLLEEARLAALIHKYTSDDPTIVSAEQALRLATIEGARALGMADRIGSLEVGKQADLVILDEKRPHLYPRHDVVSRIIYSARASDVVLVLVAGKVVVENGLATTVDRTEIMNQTQRIIKELW